MIGHDQVDAHPLCSLCGSEGANAGIDADDQAHTCGGRSLNHVVFHAVAVFDPVRNMKLNDASADLDRRFQNDDRRCAVDVVVTVNQDGFFALDGSADSFDCRTHAEHGIRRMKISQSRMQKALRIFWADDAAIDEEPGDRRGQLQSLLKFSNSVRIGLSKNPAHSSSFSGLVDVRLHQEGRLL